MAAHASEGTDNRIWYPLHIDFKIGRAVAASRSLRNIPSALENLSTTRTSKLYHQRSCPPHPSFSSSLFLLASLYFVSVAGQILLLRGCWANLLGGTQTSANAVPSYCPRPAERSSGLPWRKDGSPRGCCRYCCCSCFPAEEPLT